MEAIKVTLLVPPKNDAFEKAVFRVLSMSPVALGFAEHGCTESLLLAGSGQHEGSHDDILAPHRGRLVCQALLKKPNR